MRSNRALGQLLVLSYSPYVPYQTSMQCIQNKAHPSGAKNNGALLNGGAEQSQAESAISTETPNTWFAQKYPAVAEEFGAAVHIKVTRTGRHVQNVSDPSSTANPNWEVEIC